MEELNKDNFDDKALSGKTVVDFWAPWCGPCKMMGPAFEAAGEENQEVNFYKVNVDDEQELATKYGVRSIPTLIFFESGEVKFKQAGAASQEKITEMVKEHLG